MDAITDSHHVYDLRAKFDAACYCDDFEVDRLVNFEMDYKRRQA
ncbi:hypothetical protein P5W98_00755 [Paraburkholderia sp. A1BS-2L]